MEKVIIALPSDENYVCGLTVTAASIAMFASKDVMLSFHILDGGIKNDTFDLFEKRVRAWHPLCEFIRHAVNEAEFADFPAWSGNRMTYARLLIARFIPDENFCIYSDTDFLWLEDISKLWNLRDDNKIFLGVPETCTDVLNRESEAFKRFGTTFPTDRYICCGLTCYNLKRIREEKVVERISTFLAQTREVLYADQTAVNALFQDQIGILDKHWQRITLTLTDKDLSAPVVLHYAGEVPWRRKRPYDMITDSILLWHRVNARILGCSRWTSLRQYFSCVEITMRRLLWHIFATPVLSRIGEALVSVLFSRQHLPAITKWVNKLPSACHVSLSRV